MPFFVSALLGGLIQIAATLAGRVLVALGVGLVTYTGVSSSLTWLKTQAVDAALGLPIEAVQIMAYMKVGEFISLIFSAILARLLLNGLTSDSLKRWVTR
jgi:hypothetical protein